MKNYLLLCGFLLFTAGPSVAQRMPPALASIREPEIKTDLFEIAGDAFRGRRAGTPDELRAAVWVAQKAQEAGLMPAGDNHTYFQFFNINRASVSDRGSFTVNGTRLTLWKEVFVTQPVDIRLDAPVVWLSSAADTTMNLEGKVVAMKIVPPRPLPVAGISLWGFRYASAAVRQQAALLRRKGAIGVILIADDVISAALPFVGHNYQEGTYQLAGNQQNGSRQPAVPVFVVNPASEALFKRPGAVVKAEFSVDHYQYPSVNVVAKAPGRDEKLRSEYVLFSGHHDHDGTGEAVDGDSIYNGADDNASVTVGMLAIARAWRAKPGRRSALFVWHGAEERGLLGSYWYAAHPTVPKKDIVAVLNADMIGRNAPDSAALLGTLAPHKNSQALVDLAMKANTDVARFKVDFSWDDARHPEGWYFRSDHLPYARAGIPAIFFTTLLHPEYHTTRDDPKTIDISKLARMAKWMYATGWLVSETNDRPALSITP